MSKLQYQCLDYSKEAMSGSIYKKPVCYIVGAGENYGLDFKPAPTDFVIAADAGLAHLEERGLSANLVIGDFDTLGRVPAHENVIALSKEKDDTDMLAAVREGLKAGYSIFSIYCGTGGRIDHTIANLQTLIFLAEQKKRGFLFDRDNVITAVKDGEIAFGRVPCGYVSVFACFGKAEGVFLHGLKYKLEDAVLTEAFPIGTSNEFIGEESRIVVKNGTLLIVFPRSAMEEIQI